MDVWTNFEEGKSHILMLLVGNGLTPKSIGFLCYSGWMCRPSLRTVCQGVLELLIGNKKVTDKPTDQHAKQHAFSSSKGGVLELLIGNKKVTDKPTDQHAKQHAFSSSKGRIKMHSTLDVSIMCKGK